MRASNEIQQRDAEAGFSLIEVVMAIVVLGILTTAAIGFYFTGLDASTSHQRREVAITVANEQMEIVSGWTSSVNTVTGKSRLYDGRTQGEVLTAWDDAIADDIVGAEHTYPEWATTSPTATAALPVTRTVTRSGTEYEIRTLIGLCYQPLSGGDCTKVPGSPSTPPASAPGFTPLHRILVDVTWTAGCAVPDGCSYEIATLLDLNSDLEWVGS